jgi:hypothetical protein
MTCADYHATAVPRAVGQFKPTSYQLPVPHYSEVRPLFAEQPGSGRHFATMRYGSNSEQNVDNSQRPTLPCSKRAQFTGNQQSPGES